MLSRRENFSQSWRLKLPPNDDFAPVYYSPLHEEIQNLQWNANLSWWVNPGNKKVNSEEGLAWVGSCDHVNTYLRMTVKRLTLSAEAGHSQHRYV